MNQDIIYEVLIHLHLCPEENGGALLAKKIILSSNRFNSLILRKFDKPIVFKILVKKSKKLSFCYGSRNVTIHIKNGDGFYSRKSRCEIYTKNGDGSTLIRVFGYETKIILPMKTIDLYSIGNLTELEELFKGNTNITRISDRKWDTSDIINMRMMFYWCAEFNQNVGKNWNTANVTNMSHMFYQCIFLKKNIGKNWDVSKLTDVSGMFCRCLSLNKNIGKQWNVSGIKNMSYMFSECKTLNKNIGKNWDVSSTTNMIGMFFGCNSLDKSVGKKWKITPSRNTFNVFGECTKLENKLPLYWYKRSDQQKLSFLEEDIVIDIIKLTILIIFLVLYIIYSVS